MHKNTKIFIAFLIIISAAFIGNVVKGKNQTVERREDYIKYEKAKQDIEEGVDVKKSVEAIEEIDDKYIKDSSITMQKILAYKDLGDNKKLQVSLKEAFELDKKLEDNYYMLSLYAQTASANKDTKEVKKTLEKIKKLDLTDDEKKLVKELTKQIG